MGPIEKATGESIELLAETPAGKVAISAAERMAQEAFGSGTVSKIADAAENVCSRLGVLSERHGGTGSFIDVAKGQVEPDGLTKFDVVGHNMAFKHWGEEEGLAFSEWDPKVVNLDREGDLYHKYEYSTHLQYGEGKDAVFLKPDGFRAPSLEHLQDALKHVTWQPYMLGDV